MRSTNILFLILSTAGSIKATPLTYLRPKRQVESQMNDVDILRYALTLEHLEDKFYREGLSNFSAPAFTSAGYPPTLRQNLATISSHETAHVAFLTAALKAAGATPVEECTYAFGITSVEQFVATASLLEGVGVAAYLGAAAQIANKAYLTAAGSILTIEARHNAVLREISGVSPFPQAQENFLSPDEVHTLAHGFIVSCPENNPTFPIKAFPALTYTAKGGKKVKVGTRLTLETGKVVLKAKDQKAKLHAAFLTAGGAVWADLKVGRMGGYEVTVPEGVKGQSYLVLSNCEGKVVRDETVVAGPVVVEVG